MSKPRLSLFSDVLSTDNSSRFGNFIGEEAEASEEESQHGVDAGDYVYDDEYAEGEQEAAGQELMEIDGKKDQGHPGKLSGAC